MGKYPCPYPTIPQKSGLCNGWVQVYVYRMDPLLGLSYMLWNTTIVLPSRPDMQKMQYKAIRHYVMEMA